MSAQVSVFHIRDADWSNDGDALRQVRRAVFIVEQRIPEDLEWDDDDSVSLHALGIDDDAHPIATGRLLADGHIGRIAVMPDWRGKGVGAALFEHLVRVAARRGHDALYLNAQTHAVGFYARYGFVPRGGEFLEAGIPHIAMERALGRMQEAAALAESVRNSPASPG